ncbi:MAG: winged helix-turn-helix transcriptional regulator [Hydrogenophilales bacterium]|nr:winged helix-turn-helix transcriptional regulator [Hydrogenophilales bacterium]
MNAPSDPDNARTLEILDIVQRNEQVSQRHLARQLGVALGLANSYLKRCVKKGWVKVQQAPANRYLYYLTPTGFTEKSRLTAEYLSTSLSFYREAGDSCSRLLDQCERNGWQRLLLCGVSDLAEIATLRALERKVTIVGLYDPSSRRERFLGKQVWCDLHEAEKHDARLLTEVSVPRERLDELNVLDDGVPILVPDVLRLELCGE